MEFMQDGFESLALLHEGMLAVGGEGTVTAEVGGDEVVIELFCEECEVFS